MVVVNFEESRAQNLLTGSRRGSGHGKSYRAPPDQEGRLPGALREINRMYRLSAGGTDPIIDEASRWAFERGEIDEVRWKDWESYCVMILSKIGMA